MVAYIWADLGYELTSKMAPNLAGNTYYSTAEAAEKIGVSKHTILRWFRENRVPEVAKDTRGWRQFTIDDIERIRRARNSIAREPTAVYEGQQTELFPLRASNGALNRPTCIDLFAGAGGLALGFHNAGFQCISANDVDADAAQTFTRNKLTSQYLLGPISEYSENDFLSETNLTGGDLDCLIGGPPCQAFSVYNHQRSMEDERSRLFEHYLRVVGHLRPKSVLLENVTGMLSLAAGQALKEILAGLENLGYRVKYKVLWAERFGVPQERRRLFILGIRDDQASVEVWFPTPTYNSRTPEKDPSSCFRPFVSVRDAIGDLPPLSVQDGTDVARHTRKPRTSYQRRMRKSQKVLYNHVTGNLASINLTRVRHIPPGGSWRDLPPELLPPGMKRAKRSDHTKRYGRLDPDGLSCTILTKADPHWGSFFHFEQDRVISAREAARLQSFPDSYRFYGSLGSQFRQIGNAVPPLLAQALAKHILRQIGAR